jgi:imidazolonepropionase-like amidohydrolase
VGKAHGDRLRVSAHVESAYDFEVAVAAGVDLIAHLPGFLPDADRIKAKGAGIYRLSEDAVRRAARRGSVVITTVNTDVLRNAMPEMRAQVFDVLRWNFDVLKRHGVKIAIGSDQTRSSSVPEALMIAEAGLMTNAEVVHSLSVTTPAAIFPQRAPFGLAEGAPANFIGFDRNPLEDLESITKVSLRVKGGRELHLAR